MESVFRYNMNPMRKLLLGVTLVALLFVAGCKPPQQFGGIPRTKVYHAIVSLSPSTSELLSQYSIQFVGRTKADNYPTSINSIQIVADLKPDYEKLTRLKPDLIVLDPKLYSPAEIEKLKTITEVYPFEANSLDEFYTASYKLGNKIGGETAIMDYVDKIRRQARSSEGEKTPNPVKGVMIIPDTSGHHMIAGAKSFQADMTKIMGANPVGPDSNKFESLDPEYLMTQNPDVIFLAGDSKSFLADTRFANLKAVKEHMIVEIDPDKILRVGSRIDTTIYEGHKALTLLYTKDK